MTEISHDALCGQVGALPCALKRAGEDGMSRLPRSLRALTLAKDTASRPGHRRCYHDQ